MSAQRAFVPLNRCKGQRIGKRWGLIPTLHAEATARAGLSALCLWNRQTRQQTVELAGWVKDGIGPVPPAWWQALRGQAPRLCMSMHMRCTFQEKWPPAHTGPALIATNLIAKRLAAQARGSSRRPQQVRRGHVLKAAGPRPSGGQEGDMFSAEVLAQGRFAELLAEGAQAGSAPTSRHGRVRAANPSGRSTRRGRPFAACNS